MKNSLAQCFLPVVLAFFFLGLKTQGQNTANNFTGTAAGSLLTPANWSLGALPLVTNDAVFTATSGIRTLTAGTLTVGSFNVTAATGTFSIRNETATATNSTLTLGGVGNLGNGVSGTSADLLYVATGSTFNIIGANGGGGTGVLNLVLGQNGNFNVAGTSTISSAISGSGFGITKTGAGTLTLSVGNSYTGGTIVSAGTIAVTNSGALGTAAVTLNGGTLNTNVNLTNNVTLNSIGTNTIAPNDNYRLLSGQISGTGGFTLASGGGTPGLELNNITNNFAGNVTINSGTFLRLTNSEVLTNTASIVNNGNLRLDATGGGTETINGLSGSGAVWVPTSNNSMHTLVIGANDATDSYSGTIGASGQNNALLRLVKNGTGIQTLTGASLYSGGTTLNTGIVQVGNNAAFGTGAITLAGGDIRPTDSAIANNLISQAATSSNVINGGSGDMIYTGTITGSGIIVANSTVSRSVWFQGDGSAFQGTMNVVINGGGTNVRLGGSGQSANSGTNGSDWSQAKFVLSGTGGDRALMWNGLNNATVKIGEISGGGGRIDLGASSRAANWEIGHLNTSTTFSGTIHGTGTALTKVGTGTLTLSGANDFTGVVTVNQGTLRIGNKNAFGTNDSSASKVVVNTGGAVDFNGIADARYGYTISGSGVGGTGALVNTGGAIGTGNLQASNITLAANASIGGTGNWALLTNGHGATTLNLAGFTLTKTGSNTFTLANATITAGAISIDSGTFTQIGNNKPGGHDASAVSISLANTSGATLSLNDLNFAAGSLAGGGATGGNVSLGSGTLTVGALGTSTSYAGIISGTGGLIKTGGGTQTLTGANSFTGVVTVNNGALKIGNMNALGAHNSSVSKVVVNSGGAVDFNGIVDARYGYTISGTGVGGTGALVNTGAAIGTGNLQTSNITLAANASIGGTGNWALLTSGYAATNLNLAGFTLTKTGSNTFTLANSTITAGAISIDSGTFTQIGNNKPGGHDASAVSISLANTSGATLSLNDLNFAAGSLSGGGATGGNVSLGSGTLTVGALGTSTSYGGIISGTGSLVKTGAGTLTLTNTSNSYGGGTFISKGTLRSSGVGATQGTITLGDTATGTDNVAWLHSGGGSPSNNFVVANQGTGTATIGTYGGGFATFSGSVSLNRPTTFVDATGDRTTFTGQISGSVGTLTISGGRVTLDNTSNNFTGNITVEIGSILQINSGGGVIPDTANVLVNGDLRNGGGTNETIAGLSGTGDVRAFNPGGFNFTVGAGNATSTFAGRFLTGGSGGKLIKTGSGTLTLTNTGSTFNQVTDVNQGTLQLGDGVSNGIPGSAAIAVASGANLTFNNGPDQTFSSAVTGQGSFTKTGLGKLTLGVASTYTGNTTVNQGTLALSSTGSITSNVTVNSGGTFTNDGLVTGDVTVNAGGIRNGSGRQVGNMTVAGIHRPGNSPGVDIITGNYTIAPGGLLEVELPSALGVVPGAAGLTNTEIRTIILANNNNAYNSALNLQGGLNDPGELSLTVGVLHDALEIGGNFTVSATGTIQVMSLPSALQKGMFFDFFDAVGTTFALDPIEDSITMGGLVYLSGGGVLLLPELFNDPLDSWSPFVYDLTLLNQGIIVLVPEPSRALFVLLAAVPLLMRRRRA